MFRCVFAFFLFLKHTKNMATFWVFTFYLYLYNIYIIYNLYFYIHYYLFIQEKNGHPWWWWQNILIWNDVTVREQNTQSSSLNLISTLSKFFVLKITMAPCATCCQGFNDFTSCSPLCAWSVYLFAWQRFNECVCELKKCPWDRGVFLGSC